MAGDQPWKDRNWVCLVVDKLTGLDAGITEILGYRDLDVADFIHHGEYGLALDLLSYPFINGDIKNPNFFERVVFLPSGNSGRAQQQRT